MLKLKGKSWTSLNLLDFFIKGNLSQFSTKFASLKCVIKLKVPSMLDALGASCLFAGKHPALWLLFQLQVVHLHFLYVCLYRQLDQIHFSLGWWSQFIFVHPVVANKPSRHQKVHQKDLVAVLPFILIVGSAFRMHRCGLQGFLGGKKHLPWNKTSDSTIKET